MANKYLAAVFAKPKLVPKAGTAAAIKHEMKPETAQVVHKTESNHSLWDAHQRKNPEFPGGQIEKVAYPVAGYRKPGIFHETPIHSKIGLGLGAAGFGLSLVNFANNKRNVALAEDRNKVEAKSLDALKKIHTAIVKVQAPIAPVNTPDIQ